MRLDVSQLLPSESSEVADSYVLKNVNLNT